MNYRPVVFLLLFSFSNYTERDTVWAAVKYITDRCEHPVRLNFTAEFEEHSFLVGKSYRYNCTPGYKRKAGTSSLIRCMNESGTAQWSVPNLICIRDPKLKGVTDPPQINKGSTAAKGLLTTLTDPVPETTTFPFTTFTPSAPAQPETKATTTRTTTVEGKKIAFPETPPPSVPTTENRMSSRPVITGQDITEQSSAVSVGAKAGGSIAAVFLCIIIIAVVICCHKRKWGRNIILTPASELQPMTNPEQPPPDVMLSFNEPATENGDAVA
ncbi:interleukin-15 receptor subunit alpha isoform X4 [Polyodon spathula]|uniref:interleukin-15 receptor subunit alpha isoform X4 n=1 Tax=Polyodon spathula TaxID=7913 RepID=UPI001B7E71AA|nr:interleukin-15 receptor subunit alpha isoform X4 [Polyodon spathula]